jgi:subtilisin family serine protease
VNEKCCVPSQDSGEPRPASALLPFRIASAARRLGAVLLSLISGFAAVSAETPELPFRSDRVIVKYRADYRASPLKLPLGFRTLDHYPELNLRVLELAPGVQVSDTIVRLSAQPSVEWVEPDFWVNGGSAFNPDDPDYQRGLQWHLNNRGQFGAKADIDIDAPEGWRVRNSAEEVIVAVIDTGIRYTHEDLADNMWHNPGEIPGNGIDDDGNGVVDDYYGLNALARNGDPWDDNGHGTHIAGIIGAVGNNGKGIAGVAWNVRLMALKFLDRNNRGSVADAIRCINYARVKGAHIINASWTSEQYTGALHTAIDWARKVGIIYVVCAGNTAWDLDQRTLYPAAFKLDSVLVVAAVNRLGAFDSSYSNYGRLMVHLAAPGTSIYSTWHTSDRAYGYMTGTSMAAPQVSGALALMRAQYPEKNYRELIDHLLNTVEPLPGLEEKTISGGMVNLRLALGSTAADYKERPEPALMSRIERGGRGAFQVRIIGEPGRDHVIEASEDLNRWIPVSTNQATSDGAVFYYDPASVELPQRYYRALSVP